MPHSRMEDEIIPQPEEKCAEGNSPEERRMAVPAEKRSAHQREHERDKADVRCSLHFAQAFPRLKWQEAHVREAELSGASSDTDSSSAARGSSTLRRLVLAALGCFAGCCCTGSMLRNESPTFSRRGSCVPRGRDALPARSGVLAAVDRFCTSPSELTCTTTAPWIRAGRQQHVNTTVTAHEENRGLTMTFLQRRQGR